MSLRDYFTRLIDRVEASDEIHNGGKDDNGFYKPTRTVILQKLNILRDLHSKPLARAMVQDAWKQVVAELPHEWLVLDPKEKAELARILTVAK
ncbi:hypothetical protein BH10BDE1_BH10BDE1_13400 [soil metagenome]